MKQQTMFSKDLLSYHTKILSTPYDGSITNSYAKINATRYITEWINKLLEFSLMIDNSKVSKICSLEISRLYDLIIHAEKIDNQNWRKQSNG